jgi:hypothetical protein
LSGGRCLCKQKKNIQCGGAERKWGGDPSCETIYCLDDWRFNFIIFNELSRHNETTTTTTTTRKRRRDFLRSPFILSCASFSILTRTDTGQQPSQPRVVFFCTRGNPAGKTRESFEMIRDGPSSVRRLAILQTRVFTSLS